MRYLPSEHIKRQILRSILDGRYAPHQPLPTILDLSKTFSVSTKTVQKAIHALSEEGVIEARRGVGVFVKPIDLSGVRSQRVGVLHPNGTKYMKTTPYPGEVMDKLGKTLQRDGYQLVYCPLDKYDRMTILESIARERLCGLVLFEIDSDPLIYEIRELRLPMVSIDYDAYRHGISSVVFDNLYGTFQATRLLLDQGHRRVVFLRPMLRNDVNQGRSLDAIEEERLKGYRLAMLSSGLEPLVTEYDNRTTNKKELMLNLFGRRPSPTALVCTADWSARETIKTAKDLGFRIPEDVSVIGFGGNDIEYEAGRFLTSVQVDHAGVGAAAGEMMLAALKGDDTPRRLIQPTCLLLRDSSAPVSEVEVNGSKHFEPSVAV